MTKPHMVKPKSNIEIPPEIRGRLYISQYFI